MTTENEVLEALREVDRYAARHVGRLFPLLIPEPCAFDRLDPSRPVGLVCPCPRRSPRCGVVA